jgi:hypothetical protein
MSKIYNKNSINEIGVNAIYDGNHLDMDVFVNDNGIKTKMHTILDNNDLSKLLNVPIVSEPLEERLQRDFLYKEPIPSAVLMPIKNEPFLKKPKKRTKRVRRGKKKTKKMIRLYKTPSPKMLHIHLKPKKKTKTMQI